MKLSGNYIMTLVLAASGVACSTDDDVDMPVSDTGQIEAPLSQRAGSVLAEYEGGAGTRVHAQFLHVEGVSGEQAMDALEVWSPDRELAVDACSLRPPVRASGDAEMRLELLDVGPITIAFADGRVDLEGRRLPDMLAGVSGVVYGNEEGFDFDGAFVPYLDDETYRISAPGSSAADGFDVEIVAPRSPEIEAVVADSDVELRWMTDDTPGDTELYLDIANPAASDQPRLRCRLEDDGRFAMPDSIMQQVRGESSNLDVTLRRVHVVDIQVDDFETSEILFSASSSATLILP